MAQCILIYNLHYLQICKLDFELQCCKMTHKLARATFSHMNQDAELLFLISPHNLSVI
jgi:hypothetical protein